MISRILLILSIALLYSCNEANNEACLKYQLAYISKASGNFDIYLNDLNGNETRLTTNPSWDWNPIWNTATETLFAYAYVNDTFRIQNFDLDGNSIPFETELLEYNISPNAEMLVFQVREGDSSKLILRGIDGEFKAEITPQQGYNGRATWSPDSKQISYISDRDGNNEIYLYDILSRSTRRLTSNTSNEKYMAWSPDGSRLAFTTQYYVEGEPDRNDVFILNLTIGEIRKITNNPYDDGEITWSPNPDRIAFHSKRDSVHHIYTMKVDGTDVIQVSSQLAYHGEPVWVATKTNCVE